MRKLALFAILSFVFNMILSLQFRPVAEIEGTLVTPSADRFQVFWKNDTQGFTEENSKSWDISVGQQSFEVETASDTTEIRIDPMFGQGHFRLHSICWKVASFQISCTNQENQMASPDGVLHASILNRDGTSNDIEIKSTEADPILYYTVPDEIRKTRQIGLLIASLLLALLITLFSLQRDWKRNSTVPAKYHTGLLITMSLGALVFFGLVSAILWKMYRPRPPGVFARTQGYLVNRTGEPLGKRPGNLAFRLDPFTIYRNYPSQKLRGLQIDRNGFRGSEVPASKSPMGLVLGGSSAFGYGITQDSETIDGYLNQQSGVHFINIAVIGHLIGQETSNLVHYGLAFSPKYIVTLSGYNDIGQYFFRTTGLTYGYTSQFEEIEERLRRLAVREQTTENEPHPPLVSNSYADIKDKPPQELFKAYASYIQRMNWMANGSGARFLLLLQPMLGFKKQLAETEKLEVQRYEEYVKGKTTEFNRLYSDFVEYMMRFCREEKIQCVDLNQDPELMNTPQPIFTDVCHLTPTANQIIAKRISEQLALPTK